jgi:S1-C subfamily serine protease
MRWMKYFSLIAIVLFMIIYFGVHLAFTGIYKYQDANGVWHITNTPSDVPEGAELEDTGYDDEYRSTKGFDLKKQLSKSFPPKNAIERARNATVAIVSGQGNGSGFFITEDGYILTNRHVIGNARKHKIYLIDRTELIVYGADVSRHRDLALLKLNGYKCPYITPIDARQLADGSQVYAIGSPMGFMHSVTSGICSGKRRSGDTYYIQTNAQISPGNSGGPLITEDGYVVGINTLKFIDVAAEGLGFAISINTAFDEFKASLGKRYQFND